MRTQTKQLLGRLGRSLAFRALLIVLALYAVYHLVSAFSDRVVTDVIVEGQARDTVRGEAVVFRDETVLSTVGTYLCSYPMQNGAKVGASSTLASDSFCVWMLCTVKSVGIPMRRAAAGTSPVIQSLQ